MDVVTGHIILSDMKVELGVYEGEIPVMRFGVIQLPGNPPVGNPNSFHRFLLRGLDYNEATAFICDCGEAFHGFNDAYDHFFNSFREKDPELFQNENRSNNANNLKVGSSPTNVTDTSMGEACSGNIDEIDDIGTVGESHIHAEVEVESGESINDVGSVSINEEEKIIMKDEAVRIKLYKAQVKAIKDAYDNTESPRLIIEAIIAKFGYDSCYKYAAICGALLNVSFGTYRNYACESRKWKPEENPYNKYLNAEVVARAEKVHEMINRHISTKTLPDEMKERSKSEMIVSVLCLKKRKFKSTYKSILAKHLNLGKYDMNVLYKHVQNFKCFNYDPIPVEIKKEAEKYDNIVTRELKHLNLPSVITKSTDAETKIT